MTNTSARTRLLQAALGVFRSKGYHATAVEDLCRAAGVTKGSFFHHFASKEEAGLAAVEYWNETTSELFATADWNRVEDPRARLLAYIDFREQLVQGEIPDFTCLLGTLVQEVYLSHPALARAAGEGIERHLDTLVATIEEAKRLHAPDDDWAPRDLARYVQAVLQGGFVLAKAGGGEQVARECVRQLRRHIENLLPARRRRRGSRTATGERT